MSIDERMDKEDVIYMQMEYYSAIERNEIVLFVVTWMNLEIIRPNEASEREWQIPCDITYMWNL